MLILDEKEKQAILTIKELLDDEEIREHKERVVDKKDLEMLLKIIEKQQIELEKSSIWKTYFK